MAIRVDEAEGVEEVVGEPEEEVGGDDGEGGDEDARTKLAAPQGGSGGGFSVAHGAEVDAVGFGV